MSELYTTQELQTWHFIIELQTQQNFEMLLSQGLDEREKRQAAGARLEMPLRGQYKDLMEFYAEGKTVVMPVLSLKFLSDILLANAWLYVNGYDPRTVDDYVAMLKYSQPSRFPGGRFPQPLDALGIPQEATVVPQTDPRVRNAYFGTLLVASGFIMAHELGHVVLGHTVTPASTLARRLANERAADAFALRALSRIRTDTDAMMMYFTMTLAWTPTFADFPSRAAYEQYLTEVADHPMTGDRIQAIGMEVYNNPRLFLFREELRDDMRNTERPTPENLARVQRRGTNIIKLADLLSDERYQRALAIRAIGATLDSLRPRRINPSPATEPVSPR
jgi:hypothetical protein